MTRERLENYRQTIVEVDLQRQRLAELREWAAGATRVLTGLPHATGTSDRTADYAAEIADAEAWLKHRIKISLSELTRLQHYIGGIPNAYLRNIFTLRYINGYTWQRIANALGIVGDGSAEHKRHTNYLNGVGRDVNKKGLKNKRGGQS